MGDKGNAQEHFAKAKAMIGKMGYHRRGREGTGRAVFKKRIKNGLSHHLSEILYSASNNLY